MIRSTRAPAAENSTATLPRAPSVAPSADNAFLASTLSATPAAATPTLAAAGLGAPAPAVAPGVTPESATATASTPPAGAATSGKVRNPLPAVAGDQVQTAAGLEIRGRGVSPSAMQASAAFVNQTIGGRTDIQGRMTAARVTVVIVPRGVSMTDLPEFQSLRGQRTFDGRRWEDVRGSGGITTPEGLFAIAVPEENLVEAGPDSYGEFNVGMHEFAHALHSKGLPTEDRRRITALYAARSTASGPWTESYGASNEQEYFAQATNCFFRQNGNVGRNSPEWLRENDRPMYDFLVGLYGQPPAAAAAGPATPAPAAAAGPTSPPAAAPPSAG